MDARCRSHRGTCTGAGATGGGGGGGGRRYKSPGAIGGGVPVFLGRALIAYASLPHRARQYVQPLSIVGIVMLGLMNYLVKLDSNDGNGYMLKHSRYEDDIPGYGISLTMTDGRGGEGEGGRRRIDCAVTIR